MTADEALAEVKRTTAAIHEHQDAVLALVEERRAAIRAGRAAGLTVRVMAEAAGISTSAVIAASKP